MGLTEYTNYLGLASAPSAVINRKVMSFPAVSHNNDYYFTNAQLPEGQEKLWLDVVAEELEIPTQADINIDRLSVDAATNEFIIPCTVKYALTAQDLNLNLFAVVMEDNVTTMQKNGFSSLTNESLGEWRKGGIYGQSLVMNYNLMDVCRSYEGLTFNGTGGLLPQDMIAGEEYKAEIRTAVPATLTNMANCKVAVMLIDANTGTLINAALIKEIDAVERIDNDANVAITSNNGRIIITTDSEAQVSIYNINGALQGTTNGNGYIELEAPSCGVALVKVVTPNAVVVEKVIVK